MLHYVLQKDKKNPLLMWGKTGHVFILDLRISNDILKRKKGTKKKEK